MEYFKAERLLEKAKQRVLQRLKSEEIKEQKTKKYNLRMSIRGKRKYGKGQNKKI